MKSIPRFGMVAEAGIGDFLKILYDGYGPFLRLINRGRTPCYIDPYNSLGPLIREFIIERISGLFVQNNLDFINLNNHPRILSVFMQERRILSHAFHCRLDDLEEKALPSVSTGRPHVGICPHTKGLRLDKCFPVESLQQILSILREHVDARFFILDETFVPVDADSLCDLNLAQAIEAIGRMDAILSADSWQKYVAAMAHLPQVVVVTYPLWNPITGRSSGPAEGTYSWKFLFENRINPSQVMGFNSDHTDFLWTSIQEVDPELIAFKFLDELAKSPRFNRWWLKKPVRSSSQEAVHRG